MLARYPFILTSWGGEVLALAGTELLGKRLATFAAKKAKAIIVDARVLRDIWVKLGIDKSKIHVIPFGVDINIFNRRANSDAIKNDLHLDKDAVMTISTRFLFNHHYNIDCLIKAIPLIKKKHENARFLIKGAGPLESYLKRLAEKLGVSDSVRFVGLVPHDKVAQYLSAADIYVSTCYVDSTSVSLLEAMACGLAPVVTDIAGNREWIENGVNGFLFPPRNSEVLAEKINQLIENSQLRKSFGEKCTQIITQQATWDKCVSSMEEVYEVLLQ
jgi:glycosyltransferase involved in cell wall biosynthesis